VVGGVRLVAYNAWFVVWGIRYGVYGEECVVCSGGHVVCGKQCIVCGVCVMCDIWYIAFSMYHMAWDM
jgi:hypothetical protein